MKTKNITAAIAVLITGFIILLGLTYVYDWIEGQRGREVLIKVFGIIVFCATLYGSISFIVLSMDKKEKS